MPRLSRRPLIGHPKEKGIGIVVLRMDKYTCNLREFVFCQKCRFLCYMAVFYVTWSLGSPKRNAPYLQYDTLCGCI